LTDAPIEQFRLILAALGALLSELQN